MASKDMNNVLITTISTLRNLAVNLYRDNEGYFICGVTPQEPGEKYIMSKYRIDKIVVICSKEVLSNKETKLITENNEEITYNTEGDRLIDYAAGVPFKEVFMRLKEKWITFSESYIYENTGATKVREKMLNLFSALEFNILRWGAFLYSDSDFDKNMLAQIIGSGYSHEAEMLNQYTQDGTGRILCDENPIDEALDEHYLSSMISDAVKNYIDDNGEMSEEKAGIIKGGFSGEKMSYILYKIYNSAEVSNKSCKPIDGINDKLLLYVINDKENGIENLNGVVNAIKDGKKTGKLNLLVDVQGGQRSSWFMLYNVLRILSENKLDSNLTVNVAEVVFSAFNKDKPLSNRIESEKYHYDIMGAVSGMSSFTEYGRVGTLNNYFENSTNKDIILLKKNMERFEKALFTNDINGIEEAIRDIKNNISGQDSKKSSESSNAADSDTLDEGRVASAHNVSDDRSQKMMNMMYDILKGRISDFLNSAIYDKNGNMDYFNLINWCYSKGYILQAVTITESKMPKYLMEKGIVQIKQDPKMVRDFVAIAYAKEKKIRLSVSDNGDIRYKADTKGREYLFNNPWGYIFTYPVLYSYSYYYNDNQITNVDFKYFDIDNKRECKEILNEYTKIKYSRNEVAHVKEEDRNSYDEIAESLQAFINNVRSLERSVKNIDITAEDLGLFYDKDNQMLVRDDKVLLLEAFIEVIHKELSWIYDNMSNNNKLTASGKLQKLFLLDSLWGEYRNGEYDVKNAVKIWDVFGVKYDEETKRLTVRKDDIDKFSDFFNQAVKKVKDTSCDFSRLTALWNLLVAGDITGFNKNAVSEAKKPVAKEALQYNSSLQKDNVITQKAIPDTRPETKQKQAFYEGSDDYKTQIKKLKENNDKLEERNRELEARNKELEQQLVVNNKPKGLFAKLSGLFWGRH